MQSGYLPKQTHWRLGFSCTGEPVREWQRYAMLNRVAVAFLPGKREEGGHKCSLAAAPTTLCSLPYVLYCKGLSITPSVILTSAVFIP